MDANPFIEAYNTSSKAQYDQQYFMQHVSMLSLNVITLAASRPRHRSGFASSTAKTCFYLQQLTEEAKPV